MKQGCPHCNMDVIVPDSGICPFCNANTNVPSTTRSKDNRRFATDVSGPPKPASLPGWLAPIVGAGLGLGLGFAAIGEAGGNVTLNVGLSTLLGFVGGVVIWLLDLWRRRRG